MKKKNQMKMHCVSHVVKGTVYITIISDNNSFFYPIVCSIVQKDHRKNFLKAVEGYACLFSPNL